MLQVTPSLPLLLPSFHSFSACLQGYLFKCGPFALGKVYQLFDAVDFLHYKLKIVHCYIKREFVNKDDSHKIQGLFMNIFVGSSILVHVQNYTHLQEVTCRYEILKS